MVATYEQYRAKCKKTTDEERDMNKKKGCVTPADGTPRRTVVKVVPFDKGDVTRRDNATIGRMGGTSDDYVVLSKWQFWLICVVGIIMVLIIICTMTGMSRNGKVGKLFRW
jgi:hypothetical protein